MSVKVLQKRLQTYGILTNTGQRYYIFLTPCTMRDAKNSQSMP